MAVITCSDLLNRCLNARLKPAADGSVIRIGIDRSEDCPPMLRLLGHWLR
jgi:hypothetical protein